MKILFVLCYVGFVASCATPATQVSALKDLYNAANGAQWFQRTNWNNGDPCNNHWYGIDCDSACNILNLLLNNNNLSGTIPSTIGNLVHLQDLELDYNKLSGTIPSTIDNLSNLGYLYLNNNNLSGTIPSTIGNLVNLQWLYLSSNNLSGTIPSIIGNLVYLYWLDLSFNILSGIIPSTIGNLINLDGLYLDNNNLSGTIPSTIGNLINLQWLNLSINSLNGTVPWIQNPNMDYFNISDNQFSCPLPTWCSAPPEGDGLCSPCQNVTTTKQFCCLYSTNTNCLQITSIVCATNFCTNIPGLQLCGQIHTSECSKCFSAERVSSTKKIKIIHN